MKPLTLRSCVAIVLLVCLHIWPAQGQLHLEGLDRLYFERVSLLSHPDTTSSSVSALLPDMMQHPSGDSTHRSDGDPEYVFDVHDFVLTLPSVRRRLWIRQIVDRQHPRIDRLWWALYDGGRRSDVWTFNALPDRTDNKLLSNYYLDSLLIPANDVVVFRVRGEMFRPGGAWWFVGKEWTFAVSDSAITLHKVRNAFSYFQTYDRNETPDSLNVSTERQIKGGYEQRNLNVASKGLMNACGFRYQMLDPAWVYSWRQLSSMAECLTSLDNVRVSFRETNSRSFIERSR